MGVLAHTGSVAIVGIVLATLSLGVSAGLAIYLDRFSKVRENREVGRHAREMEVLHAKLELLLYPERTRAYRDLFLAALDMWDRVNRSQADGEVLAGFKDLDEKLWRDAHISRTLYEADVKKLVVEASEALVKFATDVKDGGGTQESAARAGKCLERITERLGASRSELPQEVCGTYNRRQGFANLLVRLFRRRNR